MMIDGKSCSPVEAIAQILELVEAFVSSVERPQIAMGAPVPSRWRPPPPDLVKVNCDGAFMNAGAQVGYGVVIRNQHGEVLGTLAVRENPSFICSCY